MVYSGTYLAFVKPVQGRSCNMGVCSSFAADIKIDVTGHDPEDGALTVDWIISEHVGSNTVYSSAFTGNTLQRTLYLHHYFESDYDITIKVQDSAGQRATQTITVELMCYPFFGCTGVEYEYE